MLPLVVRYRPESDDAEAMLAQLAGLRWIENGRVDSAGSCPEASDFFSKPTCRMHGSRKNAWLDQRGNGAGRGAKKKSIHL